MKILSENQKLWVKNDETSIHTFNTAPLFFPLVVSDAQNIIIGQITKDKKIEIFASIKELEILIENPIIDSIVKSYCYLFLEILKLREKQ